MASIKVRELGNEVNAWQSYVCRSPKASFYHHIEWREVIQKAFGHRAFYLIAEQDGDVCGIAPLFEMRSRLFGHFLVSLPFLNYGGILADTPEVERELARVAIERATRLGASHIELRQAYPTFTELDNWTLRQHKAALLIRVEQGSAALWEGLSSRLRGKVRKAEKNGATFTVGGREALADFYGLYALNMRDLGTPVYSPLFFESVLNQLGDHCRVLLVQRQGRPAAAALAICEGQRIELPWICQNYAESAFNVNEFLYWKAIDWACTEGAVELDLGRSSIDAGTYRFKMQWNPEPQPLYWYYWTAPGVSVPELNPNNPKYALAVRCWTKLPLGVANRIGPWIVRNIP